MSAGIVTYKWDSMVYVRSREAQDYFGYANSNRRFDFFILIYQSSMQGAYGT